MPTKVASQLLKHTSKGTGSSRDSERWILDLLICLILMCRLNLSIWKIFLQIERWLDKFPILLKRTCTCKHTDFNRQLHGMILLLLDAIQDGQAINILSLGNPITFTYHPTATGGRNAADKKFFQFPENQISLQLGDQTHWFPHWQEWIARIGMIAIRSAYHYRVIIDKIPHQVQEIH